MLRNRLMKGFDMPPALCVLLLVLWLPAAHAASPVPVELYAEVDHALRPAVVLADPVGYWGRTLLLGGVVVRTVSESAGVTVEIDGYRLDDNDRPESPDPALGRIVAVGADLEGALLQPGRLVTLVGTVAGWSGKAATHPKLGIHFIHAWPTAAEEAAARAPVYPPGYWCDPWWHDPWCDPWYWGPYPRWRFGAGYYRNWH